MSQENVDVSGMNVEDLPAKFGVDVFVPANTVPALKAEGRPTGGLIDQAAKRDQAAKSGSEKWKVLERRARPVLFRGYGTWADTFLRNGWKVEAVVGRPLMPDTSGKGSRVDHVPSFEPVWLLATPPTSTRA
jgi:hypothetical protein